MLALCAAVSSMGCVSSRGAAAGSSLSAYCPDESGRDVWKWSAGASGGSNVMTATGAQPLEYAGGSPGRTLRNGDQVEISLTGIPEPAKISNVVKASGFVTLPLVGAVKIAGLTTARAEELIRSAYINQQFYKSIDVIVVAQTGEFYVRGEVKKEGVFPISGDITLAQGIIMAGGYTDYAKKWEVNLIRGSETTIYDAEKSEKGEAENPFIRTGDVIVVPRRKW